jgi:hypothetical protein
MEEHNMMTHLIYKGPGVYEPRICPRCILWQKVKPEQGDPVYGVYVPHAKAATRFARVTVVLDGHIIGQLEQEEIPEALQEAA